MYRVKSISAELLSNTKEKKIIRDNEFLKILSKTRARSLIANAMENRQ